MVRRRRVYALRAICGLKLKTEGYKREVLGDEANDEPVSNTPSDPRDTLRSSSHVQRLPSGDPHCLSSEVKPKVGQQSTKLTNRLHVSFHVPPIIRPPNLNSLVRKSIVSGWQGAGAQYDAIVN
eukprot:6906761-Pyramimonas_sp.AAC.1